MDIKCIAIIIVFLNQSGIYSFTSINFIFFSSIVIRNIVKRNIYSRFNIEFMKVNKLVISFYF